MVNSQGYRTFIFTSDSCSMTRSLTMGSILYILLSLSIAFWSIDAKGHGSNKCPEKKSDTSTWTCLHGDGGEECGDDICLDDDRVECKDNVCVCPVKGDGLLLCGDKGEEVCYMISDPLLKAFTGESVSVPVSCKFPMTSLEMCLIDPNGNEAPDAQCNIESFSWGVKGQGSGRKGKHFTGGFQVKITILVNSTYLYHNTIVTGGGYNGYYRFLEWGNKAPNGAGAYGPGITTELGGDFGTIYTEYNETNNIVRLKAECCGFEMGFRPPETRSQDNQLDPGVYVKIKSDFVKEYLGKDSGLCLAPNGPTFKEFIKNLERESGKNVSRDVALLYRILKSGANQNFPNAPPQLQPLTEMASDCDTKPLICAITDCMFIMGNPKFLKCWSQLSSEEEEGDQGRRRRKRREVKYFPAGDANGEIDWSLDAAMERFRRDNEEDEGEDEDEDEDEDEEDGDEEGAKEMDRALLLMHQCMSSYCGHSKVLCETVQNAINNTECADKIKGNSIMDFDCSQYDETG